MQRNSQESHRESYQCKRDDTDFSRKKEGTKRTLLPRALRIRDLRIDSSADEDFLLVGQEYRRIGLVIAVNVAALCFRGHFFSAWASCIGL